MVHFAKIYTFATTYKNIIDEQVSSPDVDVFINALWDGSPPDSSASKPTPIQKSIIPIQPNATSSEVPGYFILKETPGKDVQQESYKILTQIRLQPIGTSVPFSMNGVNYLARLETHPPSSRNPNFHPGISLFVQAPQSEFSSRI